jgi:hypothetical protein
VARSQPINAEVPAAAPSPPRAPKRRRKPIPGALKLIAAAVVVAIAFLVAAVLGGRSTDGGGPSPSSPAPAGGQLGYPAPATENTTRIAGADPASNAAAVALATYPSTTPAQRPAAVTLVGSDDWQGAIAASVLMAAPLGAPVLIGGADGLPQPTVEAIAALDPQGSGATRGAQAFAVGDTALPGALGRVTRVKAAGPAATAARIELLRERLTGAAPAHLVIAPAGQPGLAMPAAAWAARSGDPVLFAGRDRLPQPTAAVLARHRGVPVYVLGPPAAISAKVVARVSRLSRRVRRVPGADPVSSAIALARYADGSFGWNVNDPGHGFVVARSDSPLDAAAAAPLSASGTWGPLLLTDSADTLPAALRGYLLDVKPGYTTNPTRAFYNHVWVIGDQEAIDVNQQAEIDNLAELTKIGSRP